MPCQQLQSGQLQRQPLLRQQFQWKLRGLLCALALAFAVTAAAQTPPPQPQPTSPQAGPPDFTATSVSRDPYGRTTRSRVYVGSGKVRVDPLDAGPYSGYLLLDVARQTATLVNSAQGYFMREAPQVAWQTLQSFSPGASPCPPGTPPPGASCRDIGPEKVNGRDTERWEINQTIQGRPTRTRIWVDRTLAIPVKWENSTSGRVDFTSELQNIQEGPQPANLFAIPPGLRDATPASASR